MHHFTLDVNAECRGGMHDLLVPFRQPFPSLPPPHKQGTFLSWTSDMKQNTFMITFYTYKISSCLQRDMISPLSRPWNIKEHLNNEDSQVIIYLQIKFLKSETNDILANQMHTWTFSWHSHYISLVHMLHKNQDGI